MDDDNGITFRQQVCGGRYRLARDVQQTNI